MKKDNDHVKTHLAILIIKAPDDISIIFFCKRREHEKLFSDVGVAR